MIRLDHVEKTYRTRRGDLVHALDDITLEVGENEFVTLVGPSGCGKSTLLEAGVGPRAARPQGTIHIRGQAVREPFPDVGFVFQQPVLLPVALGARQRALLGRDARAGPARSTASRPATCSS